MSGWTQFNANGALADTLVTDFSTLGPFAVDGVLCVLLKYNGATAIQVRIFSATAAAVAEEFRNDIYNSATQLNPGADQTQKLNDYPSQIIIEAGVPWTLRITKAAGNAQLWWRVTPVAGPGC